MIAKVIIQGKEKYISNVWFADHEIVGDCNLSEDPEMALDIDEDDLPFIKEFYKYYNIEVISIEE